MNQTTELFSAKAVLFDLDGTLLDTAPDLVAALNTLLEAHNKAPVEFLAARNLASQGSAGLTQLGFPEVIDEQARVQLKQQYLDIYAKQSCVNTQYFPQMQQLLTTLEEHKTPWGIVTNKPGWLTDPILEHLNITTRTACVVSGDTLAKRKPHPDPLLLASKTIKISPENCVYVGDDPRDIYAGNAAGMYTCVANYGYIEEETQTDRWGADFLIDSPLELLNHIQLS